MKDPLVVPEVREGNEGVHLMEQGSELTVTPDIKPGVGLPASWRERQRFPLAFSRI